MKTYSDNSNIIIALLTALVTYLFSWQEIIDIQATIRDGLKIAAHISFIGFIVMVIVSVYLNWGSILLAINCGVLHLRGIPIRFSMAYLYIIEIEGKYLLVKNSNFDHYQLVGGKYKVYDQGKHQLKELGVSDDRVMDTGGVAKDDLAKFVPAKNALKFLNWFKSGQNREVSHWREFYEELLSEACPFLSKDKFRYVDYCLESTVITPIKTTPEWGCSEILSFDILKLIPTSEQESELKQLFLEGNNDRIKWVDRNLIDNLGWNSQDREIPFRIGSHTKWALDGKYTK